MAELEVIAHLKKAIKVWRNPQHTMWHKIKEFLLEIFIIVFAVSLSIGLHSWSEARHEQDEVRHFMQDLAQNLTYDLKEYQASLGAYQLKAQVFDALVRNSVPDSSQINQLYLVIHDFDSPIPSRGRYESFKYSGKLGHIHDNELSAAIVSLFEEDTRRLQNQTDFYIRLQTSFHDKMNELLVFDSTGRASNVTTLVTTGVNYNLSRDLMHTEEIQAAYQVCIRRMHRILELIHEEYPGLDAHA
ncbi:MAG: hypothetical protein EOP52_00790 [Sphingobacteriales bacterium]|nr:MAG: hypothetical protein EOP52_00790 [Sphingobacteriales bacterium]